MGSAVWVAEQLKKEMSEVLPAYDVEYAKCSVSVTAVTVAGYSVTAILQSGSMRYQEHSSSAGVEVSATLKAQRGGVGGIILVVFYQVSTFMKLYKTGKS